MLQSLCELQSYKAISTVLNDIVLKDLQCVDVLKLLYRGHGIISYPTGTGKTFIASALCKMVLSKEPDRHFLFLIKNGQIVQTPDEVRKATGLNIGVCDGTAEQISHVFGSGEFKQYNGIMLTHPALQNLAIIHELQKCAGWFDMIVIDEAHNLCNAANSISGMLLQSLCWNAKYVYALTATPLRSELSQVTSLASIVDHNSYPNPSKLRKDLVAGRFDIADDPCFFITRTRKELGAEENIVADVTNIAVTPEQLKQQELDSNFTAVLKGNGSYAAAERLVSDLLFRINSGKRILVHIRQHQVREWVLPFLDRAGIRYRCVNGLTTHEERARYMKEFNQDRTVDVVITSITEALNLDCDCVIFYELTLDVTQMIGRAYRGYAEKTLEIIFYVCEGTKEETFFFESIYRRELLNQRHLRIECRAITEAARRLGVQ